MTLNACVLILIRRGYLTFPRHGDRGICNTPFGIGRDMKKGWKFWNILIGSINLKHY